MLERPNPAAIVDHARGVLAERFGVGIHTADSILHEVARRQRTEVTELAAAIVGSCTSDTPMLPRDLYSQAA
jgi:hypothetical protein